MHSFLKFVKVVFVLTLVCFQNVYGNEKLCKIKENCEKCLAADYNCAWCTDKNYVENFRCMTKDELLSTNCNPDFIIENQSVNEVLNNDAPHDFEENGQQVIQIQPQKIKLKLVKSFPQRIKLTYRPAKNNPLDLYYLMDLTWTMRDDKETLVKIGEQLTDALHTLTANYRLGFGSFADKPIMPMASPSAMKNPCAAERDVCEPTYGFRHHLALTKDIGDFVEKVNSSKVTGNLDNLEGGFDALMQVIVCPDEIGWSEGARKIVVLVTDGFMHFAGDGLLAGIVQKNDKKCHLNSDGEYDGTLVYDYPSLEEIYRELLRRKISVIFAVTGDVVSTYRQISNLMKEISNVEIVSLDSSNILEVIKKSYQSFIKKAQFEDNSPSYIAIDYETNCGGLYKRLKKTNVCNNAEMGKELEFYINVTLKDFPNDGKYNHIIRIGESRLSEYLEIDVEIQPACPCNEEPIPAEDGNLLCNNHGEFQCGMCNCSEGWLGTSCSCDSGNYTTIKAMEIKCRPQIENSTELGPICSNRGECECGQCHNCALGYNGDFCECPKCEDDCDLDKADCYCGKCVCKFGWSGSRCNCQDSTEGCIAPNGEICSKRGLCNCGQCYCDEFYTGDFCEIGINSNKLCAYYEPCVKCLIEEELGEKQCTNPSEICSNMDETPFEYFFTSVGFDSEHVQCFVRLTTKDDQKCDHYYIYDTDKTGKSYLLIKIEDCSPPNYATIGMWAFLLPIILGIITLIIYKIIVTRKDRIEYTRFERERNNTEFKMESPIYKNPITNYTVPNYEEDNLDIFK